jgi:type IV pilus assembly protein PilV
VTGTNRAPARAAGFSMLEVMVAFAVICIGLLGVAKLQALSLSNTSLARGRALAALEAAGMAAAMHANRGYWTTALPAAASPIIIQGTPAAINAATLQPTSTCTTAGVNPCTPEALAAADLQNFGNSLQALLSGYQATIWCGAASPVTCTITITWTENTVALNQQESQAQSGGVTLQGPVYELFVTP